MLHEQKGSGDVYAKCLVPFDLRNFTEGLYDRDAGIIYQKIDGLGTDFGNQV